METIELNKLIEKKDLSSIYNTEVLIKEALEYIETDGRLCGNSYFNWKNHIKTNCTGVKCTECPMKIIGLLAQMEPFKSYLNGYKKGDFDKLKITENTVIHCNTEELADKVLAIFDNYSLNWNSDTPYLNHNNWCIYKQNTCYNPFGSSYCELRFYQNTNYNIITAEEFLKLHDKTVNSKYIVTKADLIGSLSKYSIKLAQLAYDEMIEQCPNRTIKNLQEVSLSCLFAWGKTFHKHDFWSILVRDIGQFYEEYPEYKPEYTCELDKFPPEVIELMLQRQVEAGNTRDITIFKNELHANTNLKGFSWHETLEGKVFWKEVINNRNFDLFFEVHPKDSYNKDTLVTNAPIQGNNMLPGTIGEEIDISYNTPNQQDKYTSMSNNLKINQDEEDKLFN